MRDWGRLFATAVVWIAVAAMLNNLTGELTRVYVDFTGVWPNVNYTPEEVMQASGQVGQAVMNIINQATTTINNQMASNVPALIILAALLIIGAALSTFFIWRNAGLAEAAAPMHAAVAPAIKSKRGSRVNQMLDSLSDAELDELRARLGDDEAALGDLIDRRLVNR